MVQSLELHRMNIFEFFVKLRRSKLQRETYKNSPQKAKSMDRMILENIKNFPDHLGTYSVQAPKFFTRKNWNPKNHDSAVQGRKVDQNILNIQKSLFA